MDGPSIRAGEFGLSHLVSLLIIMLKSSRRCENCLTILLARQLLNDLVE